MDIPEDIHRKVGEVLGRPGERMGVDQYLGLSLRVGLALAEERERAAVIAEEHQVATAGKPSDYTNGFNAAAEIIAAAIRNPPEQPA